MPPRWLCVGILLFWLTVTGRLFWRELLPRLQPGQPPPYTIDLHEEAHTSIRARIHWRIYHQGKEALSASTRVDHPERDVFELIAEYRGPKRIDRFSLPPLSLRSLTSVYRVNGAGDLLGMRVAFEGRPELGEQWKELLNVDFRAVIQGDVQNGKLAPRLELEIPGGKPITRQSIAIDAPRGGAVLLPLHPVNRLRGLSPGQRWTMTAYDPMDASLGAMLGTQTEPRLLRARVRDEEEMFSFGRRRDRACLVVDYEGDDFTAITRVDRDTGLVLCQEVSLGKNNHWAMYRD